MNLLQALCIYKFKHLWIHNKIEKAKNELMYMNKEFRYPQIYTVNSYMNSYTECFCRIISFMTDMLFIYIYSCIIHIYMNLCTMYIMMNS